ncbi:Na(+)/H(+) antiporter subunit B [Candidatus Endowatersipora endosymbiont of Watersipora subatra]|uniref:Na(+)/H(+) antiporter subunit B n=1 Tax=Candidatus Endowatersipora endosymbiont of Watersipora subatra TaxID=3077946 RepID=UPI00312CA30C
MVHHLILRIISKLLIGPILLFGLYVQFHGDVGPGGGFQAGVIFAVAFVLYALVFGLDRLKCLFSEKTIHSLAASGVLIYAGIGIMTMLKKANFLDYNALSKSALMGQHLGILVVEFGIGVTVFAVILTIYYGFASRKPSFNDKDW